MGKHSFRWYAALVLAALTLFPGPVGATESDSAADLLWVQQSAPSVGEDGYVYWGGMGFRVAAVSDGGSVTFGYLGAYGHTFGAGGPNETALTGDGLFLAKHDADGALVWARQIPGGGDPMGIVALSDGGFAVTGNAYEPCTLGVGEANEVELATGGGFIARYGADGTLSWAFAEDLAGGQTVGISAFGDDSLVVTGAFGGEVEFGRSPGTTQTLDSVGWTLFVARYSAEGDLAWVRAADGTSLGWGVAALSDGSCVVGGRFGSYYGDIQYCVFGVGEANETILSATEPRNICVARFLADGSLAWARGAESGYVEAIQRGPDDSVVVTGTQGHATFAPGEAGEVALDTSGFYAARYSVDGTLQWVRTAAGDTSSSGWNVGSFADGSWVVVGYGHSDLTFGDGEAGETTLTGGGGFTVGYASDGTLLWAEQVVRGTWDTGHVGCDIADSGSSDVQLTGVATYGDGTFVVTGSTLGPATFGPGESNETTVDPGSGAGPLVYCWDVGGEVQPDVPLLSLVFARYRAFDPNASPVSPESPTADLTATMPSGETRTVEVSFSSLEEGGLMTVTTATSGPEEPAGFKLGEEAIWYDVSTTATYSGTIELCFSWNEGDFANEANIALFHYANGAWIDVTTSLDTEANIVCGQTSSLSPFVLAEVAYGFGGIQQPVNADGSSVFKAGSVVPLKFALYGPDGDPRSGVLAELELFRLSSSVEGTDEEVEVASAGQADTGDVFRYDASAAQYLFNLSTKGLAQGAYRLDIHLDDGSTHPVWFSLRDK
jgi:hypothetical protein